MRSSVSFEANNQEIVFRNALRPRNDEELQPLRTAFEEALRRTSAGAIYLNTRRLRQLNEFAFRELGLLLQHALEAREDLRFVIVTTSVVGWGRRRFSRLAALNERVEVRQYDEDFYPGQSVLENSSFIPILRTQTKMTWRHEEAALHRHGLQEGMVIADICCGIGDFAVLVQRAYQPARLVALDHSKPSLNYARQVARDFGVRAIEYTYGDASAMLLDDDQFDFVSCRHSLQVFNRPEQILAELYRICKPGGRVYITNEKNSHCLGEPRSETIQWTYNEVANLWAHFEMDIELGPKTRGYLDDAGFEDVRMESFMVTNLDGDPQDFADIVQAWEDVYAGEMAVERGDDEAFLTRFHRGFQDHIRAALNPQGYAGWPIWIASGRKPVSKTSI